ncbi:MAG: hypothetical protein LBR26_06960 [Prevotella sp.]|jgi:hypothetical protein|nr:hypothetical protein [Prevotella sp.]
MKPVVLYGLITGVFLSFGSCKNTDDEFQFDDVLPPVPEGYVRMQITVPGLTPVSTYALDAADETRVSTVDVLVFDASNDTFLCHAEGESIVTDGNDSNKKTFDVDLRAAGNIAGAYVMVVANAHETVNVAANTPSIASATKEDVMKLLEFPSSGKWNVNGNSSTPFPMWGMTPAAISLNTSAIPAISLIRSVAKIDVGIGLDADDAAQGLPGGTTFTLESVELHNSLDKGSVAPYSNNHDPLNTTAVAASIPGPIASGTTAPGINPAIPYSAGTASDGFSTNKFSCTGAIYMAEHAAGDRDALSTNPYLVIGGKYNGSSTATYYRLDFVSGSYPNQEFLPVLRNHRYRFNITEVKGSGYTSAALAAAARPVNLTYDLSATDESLTSYDYDGQYTLGVSQDSYTLDNKAQSATLQVSTTYEKGYKAESDQSWLTIATDGKETTTANSPGSPTTLTFNVAAYNSGYTYPGTITITSGRLKKNITVNRKSTADGFTVSAAATSYPATGGPQTDMKVTSSYKWQVRIKSDPDAIITDFDSGGNAGSGLTFNFTLINNSSTPKAYGIPEATFTFFSPTGEFLEEERTVKLPETMYLPPQHKGWAGSNIYWDGNRLTFAASDDPDINTKKCYQGVYFKWGSLCGLDASGANSSTWTNKIIYQPNWNINNPASSSWSTVNSSNWADISCVNVNANNRNRAYLYEAHKPVNRLGDICRYLTQTGDAPGSSTGTKWRIPTSNEFEAPGGTYPLEGGGWSSQTSDKADGTYIIGFGRIKTGTNNGDAYQPFFPAAGWRYYADGTNDGKLWSLGVEGLYRTSSPGGNNYVYELDINSGRIGASDTNPNTFAFNVRCVKE